MHRFYSLLFWLLFPFALVPGLRLRKNPPQFRRADGDPEGVTQGDGRPGYHIVGIGDSIIDGVGVKWMKDSLTALVAREYSGRSGVTVHWRAVGKTGARCKRITERQLPQVCDHEVDLFILSVGVNDITGLTSLHEWSEQLTTLLMRLKECSPSAKVLMAGIPPMHRFPLLSPSLKACFGARARAFDVISRKVTDQTDGVYYLPLFIEADTDAFSDDGYHPSAESYRKIAAHLTDLLPIKNQ